MTNSTEASFQQSHKPGESDMQAETDAELSNGTSLLVEFLTNISAPAEDVLTLSGQNVTFYGQAWRLAQKEPLSKDPQVSSTGVALSTSGQMFSYQGHGADNIMVFSAACTPEETHAILTDQATMDALTAMM